MKQPFTPEIFGKYFLLDRIAVGGMAEIFKAKTFSHSGFEKLQVIKRILSHHSVKEDFVEMFIKEAKITALLQHPNIVYTYDFGKLHENCYIAMECVEGKDTKEILKRLSKRGKLLPEEFAVYIAHEVLMGLEHAHTKSSIEGEPLKIVHRDVSPANVLISYDGEVKVADFGIATTERASEHTQDGVIKGKFEYMSPEQASGERVDHRTDIFSASIILWEMLTGRRLFKTHSDMATLEKIKGGDYPRPSTLNPRVGKRLDEIVMKGLALKRENRYQSAQEFSEALAAFLYPNTPGVVRRSLSEFMKTLYATAMENERKVLAKNSEIAEKLYNEPADMELDLDWEGDDEESSSSKGMILGLAILAVVAIGGGIWWSGRAPSAAPVETSPIQEVAPTETARMTIHLEPEHAVAWEGDVRLGEGPVIQMEDVPVGSHMVRVEAEGFLTDTEQVFLVAGERVVQRIRLRPDPDHVAPEGSETPDEATEEVEAPSEVEAPEEVEE